MGVGPGRGLIERSRSPRSERNERVSHATQAMSRMQRQNFHRGHIMPSLRRSEPNTATTPHPVNATGLSPTQALAQVVDRRFRRVFCPVDLDGRVNTR